MSFRIPNSCLEKLSLDCISRRLSLHRAVPVHFVDLALEILFSVHISHLHHAIQTQTKNRSYTRMELFILKTLARTLPISTFPLCQNIHARRPQVMVDWWAWDQSRRWSLESLPARVSDHGSLKTSALQTQTCREDSVLMLSGQASLAVLGTPALTDHIPSLFLSLFPGKCPRQAFHVGSLNRSQTLLPSFHEIQQSIWREFRLPSDMVPQVILFSASSSSHPLWVDFTFYFSKGSAISLIYTSVREHVTDVSTGVSDSWTRVPQQPFPCISLGETLFQRQAGMCLIGSLRWFLQQRH